MRLSYHFCVAVLIIVVVLLYACVAKTSVWLFIISHCRRRRCRRCRCRRHHQHHSTSSRAGRKFNGEKEDVNKKHRIRRQRQKAAPSVQCAVYKHMHMQHTAHTNTRTLHVSSVSFTLVVFIALVQSCRGSNSSITRIPSNFRHVFISLCFFAPRHTSPISYYYTPIHNTSIEQYGVLHTLCTTEEINAQPPNSNRKSVGIVINSTYHRFELKRASCTFT